MVLQMELTMLIKKKEVSMVMILKMRLRELLKWKKEDEETKLCMMIIHMDTARKVKEE